MARPLQQCPNRGIRIALTRGTLRLSIGSRPSQRRIDGKVGRVDGRSLVLVVVAEAGIRDLICTILEEFVGVQTALAQDEEEALHKAKQLRPAMVLLDLWLCKTNGFHLLRELKSDSTTRGIPVLAISTWRKDQDEAVMAGCADFIEEPFEDLDVLITTLRRHVHTGPT